jgi:nucleotide-binding universal stress UspA family protein
MKIRTSRASRNVIFEVGKNSDLPPVGIPELQVKRILVPVDFSDCSRKAFHYAVHFARQFNAELVLLNVLVDISSPPEMVMLEGERINALQRDAAGKELSKWRKDAAGVSVNVLTRSGSSIHNEISEAARESNCDLIVIGNHGRSAFSRFFIGGNAERVVRHAPCPVLVIREREHDFIKGENEEPAESEQKAAFSHQE